MARRIMGGIGRKKRRIIKIALNHPKITSVTKLREVLKGFLSFPFLEDLTKIIISIIDSQSLRFEESFNQCIIYTRMSEKKIVIKIVVRKNSILIIFSDRKTNITSISIGPTIIPGRIFSRKEKENYTISINVSQKIPFFSDFEEWFVGLTDKFVFLAISQGAFFSQGVTEEL